ncbi:MAG TPA: helix-turn-helix domain-containing protein [Bacteroidota bacterium]|nr:helix-turn-helix domain-containing protein [Bacteroidota bacterium]
MTTREIKQFNADEFYTVEEAAKVLGIKESAIRNYLSLGRLITYKIKSLTLLKADEVKRWKDRQRNR